jgi:hypothetical protein
MFVGLITMFFVDLTGFLVCELEMQKVFPQPFEAFKAHMDCHVQKAA